MKLVACFWGEGLKKLGKYELLGELGRGAFGVVYRAKDPDMNRMVALKTLTGAVAEDPNLLERFYREARSAGGLQHPNIVTIHELGDEGGTPFIAMELVDGPNLSDLIGRHSPLALSLKLAYCVQACRAFDYAHKRGIIHRDIKPGNVMVTKEDVVKVVDFGIARVIEGSKTQTGTLIGTFAYMAPEVFHGAHARERSDIWSFGVLLYEFIAYRAPFGGGSPAALMHTICQQEPVPLRQLAADCPEDLESVVHRALRKSEAERYQTMEDLLLELDPICKRVQAESLAQMLEQARRLMGQGEFAQAREVLRQALRVDATNVQARALSEKVNVELKRLAVRPKAQEHVDKGHALLQEGKLQGASAEADNALHLDSQFQPARELQQEIQRNKERLQLADEYLQSARQRLVEGLPDEAEALFLKAQEVAPTNPQLALVQQQVREEKERRQRRAQLQEGMRQARILWTQQNYRECFGVLTELQRAFPTHDEVARLLDTVREDEAEQAKQEQLTEARDRLAARQYEESIAILAKLKEEYPKEEEIERLLQAAREDQAKQTKQKALNEARQLLAALRYEECTALLTRLRREFPRDDEISRVLKTAHEDQAEQNRRAKLAEVRSLLAARRHEECLALLTRLQQELPRDEEIGRLLETVRRDRAEQNKQERLSQARSLLAGGDYEQCLALLTQLDKDFAGDTEIQRLLEIAHQDRTEQGKRDKLAEARKLLSARHYEECIALLVQLERNFPKDDDIARLLHTAREDQREQDRKQKLAAARDLLATQRFADALSVLEPLLAADPKDSAVLKLHTLVLREQQEHAKSETLQREWEILKSLTTQKAYSEAITRGENLLRQFPGETDLTRLVEFARTQQARMEQELRLRACTEQVEEVLQANRLPEAAAAARAALEAFPGHPDLTALLQRVESRMKKEMVRELIERRVRDIKLKINRGQLTEARELAREALRTLGPDTDVRQLLWSAELEFEAREKKDRQEAQLESVRAFLRAGKLQEATAALDDITRSGEFDPLDPRLYDVGGEIAAAWEAAGSSVPAKSDTPIREYVISDAPPAIARAPGWQQATQQTSAPSTPGAVPAPGPPPVQAAAAESKAAELHAEFPPAAIDRAARLLARYIGPISGVLAKRAAQRSDSLRTLYLILAENVESEAERARFLRDAGFSDL